MYVRAHQRERVCAEVGDGLNKHHNRCMHFFCWKSDKIVLNRDGNSCINII